ncbi:MAG: phosphate ABC transporter permease PstA [Lachnospiraceae bacterium]|nr:phosphate ABC transporter permease PstA [Lachnospiraceae bacterium]
MPVNKVNTLKKTKSRRADKIAYFLIYLSAGFTVLLLMGIIGYVAVRGYRVLDWEFVSDVTSVLRGTTGVAGNILNTVYIVLLTLLIATPIGIGSAIYLNEYAKPGKLVRGIEFATETLAGIPSIIYGMFGAMFFGATMKFGYSILTGSLTLMLMVLPLITRNTQEALKTVPMGYRLGAIGMGAQKWYMIRTILLPSAMPGIVTGIILSVGRIVGESAALLFTAGSGYYLPQTVGQLGSKIMESGGTLTIQMYLSMQKGKYDIAFGIALVLLLIVLFINIGTKKIAKSLDVSRKGM